MFIGGECDDVPKFYQPRASSDNFVHSLPRLQSSQILAGAGHWIQRERADAVRALLLQP